MWLDLYTPESHGDPAFNIPGIPQLRALYPMSGYDPNQPVADAGYLEAQFGSFASPPPRALP